MVLEQREAGTAVAATDAAMPSPQYPACAATGFSEALASSSCNDELPDHPDSHGSFTLTDPESQFCRNGKAKLDPSETQNMQILVKEGKLRVGHYEVLNTVIYLSEECDGTCGSRLVQLSGTAMNEGLTSRCSPGPWVGARSPW